jgi:hypothetical protein
MITSFNIHDVTEVRATRHESLDGGTVRWTEFDFIGPKGTLVAVTAFAPEGYVAVEVEPADDEPDEMFPSLADDTSYRADMINAGRGHLLGD